MIVAAVNGLLLSLSLIVAIGAQNAFVLRQGLRRQHVLAVCLTCALSDALLITLGVVALSAINEALPGFEPVLRYGGAAFLLAYGLRSLLSAWRGGNALALATDQTQGLAATLATLLAFTFLNPHVYLDTVLLIGSVASQYPGAEAAFGAGAAAGSFLFFFALGYGARLLAPLFARPSAWRILDGVIAVVMVLLAAKLVA
ncbi:LysE family transporter [Microvirga tunisiensis]|uniref:LysE family transporter n=1 Tax=Pannonibacter tanglangensis TaxID=2750084 RepID=A0A7X5J7P2_9HYPH|nr:LysE/ArgO family amino acid transporter [Pannonibacter sp. XCT-53]NBN76947.1 LysE family transporter [Pannonibacter sp. XCT-53]